MVKRNVFIFLLVAIIAMPLLAMAGEPAGNIVSMRGTARIERQAKAVKASVKSELFEGDVVITGENSRVKILFRDDSIVTVGSLSRVSVDRYLYDAQKKRATSLIRLLEGKLRSLVGNADFEVTTPTALAAARGTVFIVWFDGKSDSSGIAVLRGKVEVKNLDPSVEGVRILAAGMMTSVTRGMPPSPAVPIEGITTIRENLESGDRPTDDGLEVARPAEMDSATNSGDVSTSPDAGGASGMGGANHIKSRGMPHDNIPNPGKHKGQNK